MHWAINITKAIDEPEDITLENIQTLIDNITDEIMKKMPYGVSTLKHLERKSAAFGPFERPTHARTMPASDLDEEHKAVQYLNSRMIHYKYRCRFSYTEDFKRLIEIISPDKSQRLKSEERIVIPFFNRQNKLTHIQGRALDDNSLRYITVSLSQGSKVYGLDRIDNTKPVYVVEGIFDSLFLENCVAMTGSDLNTEDLQDCELVFLFDNEPRNRQIVQKVEKIIDMGHSIVLFNDTFEGKDINDMIQSGHTIEQVKDYIENNTFKSLKAKMKFTEWRKL